LTKTYLKTKDYFLSGEDFILEFHPDLEMLVTTPVPNNLSAYYESDDYISHTDAKKGIMAGLYQKVKNFNLSWKLALINKYADGPRKLLDVGSGTGDFLVKAQQDEWMVSGVEPNEKATEHALKKGIATKETLCQLGEGNYSAITLWHVLEHLPNLDQDVDTLTQLLDEAGILVIAVPNFKSFDANYYGQYWAGYDVPRHLWHFSKSAIQTIFEEKGLELISIKPMRFDAFYVSMLSEKYRKRKLGFLLGGLIGLVSNISALFTGEHSSLTYVFQKKALLPH